MTPTEIKMSNIGRRSDSVRGRCTETYVAYQTVGVDRSSGFLAILHVLLVRAHVSLERLHLADQGVDLRRLLRP